MSLYQTEYVCRVEASVIWSILGDIRRWREFDTTLRRVTADGPTVVGQRPLIEIYSRPPRRACVLAHEKRGNGGMIQVALPFVRPLPGVNLSQIITTHEVSSTGQDSRILSSIAMSGPFPEGVRRWLARDFLAGLSVRVEQLMVVAHAVQEGRSRPEGARSNEQLAAAQCRKILGGREVALGE